MDGIQFLVEVRKHFGLIPFILFTGKGREEIVIQAINNGADFYLQKGGEPFSQFAELLNKVKYAVSRRVAEESLQSSEELFRVMFERANDGIFLHNLLPDGTPGTYIKVNNIACERLGYTEVELLEMSPIDIVPPEHLFKVPQITEKIKNEGHGKFEAIHQRKDGTKFPVEISTSVLILNGKKVALSIARDITDRKESERAIREVEEKLEEQLRVNKDQFYSTLASMDDLVFVIDNNNTFVDSHQPARSNLYLPPEKFVGKQVNEVFNKELAEVFQNVIERVRITGCTEQIRYQLPIIGQSRWFDAKLSPLHNPLGIFTGVTAVVRDITEQVNVEEALKESREKYRSILKNAVIGIYRVREGRFLSANSYAAQILGYSSAEELIESITDIDTQIYADPKAREISKRILLKEGVLENFETPCLHKDGSIVWVSFNAKIVRDEEGNILYHEGTSQNISERKKMENAIRQANRKLNLLSQITRHDIKNQLIVQNSFLQLLEEELPEVAINEYFRKLKNTATRIFSLIQFTKEYEQIGVTEPGWIDCQKLVSDIANQASPEHVLIKNDIDVGFEVFSDPLIAKVFYNLIDNSISYGEKITQIRFSLISSPASQVIICEDDGVGIPLEDKENIFKRGFGKHTGFGLAISREILDITGISICENGKQGEGARFELTFPDGCHRFKNNTK